MASLPDFECLNTSTRRRLCICLVSDFSYPRMGGVEIHQYFLAQGLIRRGHKVIILTGTYDKQRQGVRYLNSGLKVFYCPFQVVVQQATVPTRIAFLPLLRNILIREQVDIIHGHQSTSAISSECMLHAKTMGYKCVYTDHSLFGFADFGAIHVNKWMKFALSEVDHVICVSHTSKENLVLRAYLDPQHVSVIPNAIDSTKFTPDPLAAPLTKERVNIVLLSRLVYRKGVDLVVQVIPEICRRFPNVYFIIGGDGPKRINIEQMREQCQLHDRIEMLGCVEHSDVRDVLVRGHIFFNASLTEAFCIAILEAACCGLYTVSTGVGGVPEVLPSNMITLTQPNARDLVEALSEAIPYVRNVRPLSLHEQVRKMYSWNDVAERTERVYERVMTHRREPLFDRLRRYYECGPIIGKFFCAFVASDYILWRLIEWLWPRDGIDKAINFPAAMLNELDDNDFMEPNDSV